jgi:hypothetical protein
MARLMMPLVAFMRVRSAATRPALASLPGKLGLGCPKQLSAV